MMEAQNNKKTLTIFQKEKNPMQSGESNNAFIGVVTDDKEYIDYDDVNMGWSGSSNMLKQIHLNFDNLTDAEAFAKKYNYNLSVREMTKNIQNIKKKSYFDNFRKKNS